MKVLNLVFLLYWQFVSPLVAARKDQKILNKLL